VFRICNFLAVKMLRCTIQTNFQGMSLLVCEFAFAIVKSQREMFLVRGVLLLRHSLKCKWRLLSLGFSIVALPCYMCITVMSISVFSVGNEELVS